MHSTVVLLTLLGLSAAAPKPQLIDTAGVVTPAYNVSFNQPVIGPRDRLDKRDGNCAPQPAGSGPVSSPDTPEAFSANPAYSNLALNASTPDGYSSVMQNVDAYLNASNHINNSTLTSYDTIGCASLCDRAVGCQAFNLYVERDPTLDPNTVSCPNPPSLTNFNCTLWGRTVSAAQATNRGYLRASFRVVIAGSNAYNKAAPPPSVACYAGPTAFGGAIQAPLNAMGQDTFLGNRFRAFSATQDYDTSRCAADCSEQTGYNSRHPAADGSYKTCAFFNPYVVTKNGVPQGFQCALYTDVWDASYGTNYGYNQGTDRYTISRSFGYSLKPAGEGPTVSCPPVTSSSSRTSTTSSLPTSNPVVTSSSSSSSSSRTSTTSSLPTSNPVVTSSSSSSLSVPSTTSSSSTSATFVTSTTTRTMTTSTTATPSSTTTSSSTTSQTTTAQSTTASTTSQQQPTTSSTSSTIGTPTTSTSAVSITSTTSAASTPASTTTSSRSSSTTSSVSSTTSSSSTPTTPTTSTTSSSATSTSSTSTSATPFATGFCLQNPSTGEYAHLSRGGNGLEFGPKSAESLPSLYTLDASSRLVSTVSGLIAVLDLPTFGSDGSAAGYTLGVNDDQLGTCPTYKALVCDVSTGDLQCRSAANYIDPVKTPATRSQVYTLTDGNNGVDRVLFAPASGAVAVKVRPGAECGQCAITYS
ncbi:MAG: hypothetical protein Q9210_003996 [Variospora velana]